jgi:hypothetical protein
MPVSRTAVRALLVTALGFLTGAAYVRRDQVVALFSTHGTDPVATSGARRPQSDRPFATTNPQSAIRNPQSPQIGMNLAGVADWSTQWAFVNAFKAARQWQEEGPKPFAYDARGNPLLKPGQRVSTYLLRELGGHYPGGRYVVTWQGTGRVHVNRFDVTRVVSVGPNRLEIDVTPGDGGLLLEVSESAPVDPVRDIRVTPAAFEHAASPFHPLFVERLRPFGVVRFMGWQQTNNCPTRTWAERPTPDDARWSSPAGVPLEIVLDLANTLGAHPWLCIPHRADDDFVRRFARTVRDRLRPDLRVYVEYSNEVWNATFEQARYAEAEGRRLGLGEPARQRYYARRSVEIFRTFEDELGGRDRLVRVLGAQAAGPWLGEQTLTWQDAYRHADAVAIAPYFGHRYGDPRNAPAAAALGVDQLLDGLAAEIDGPHRAAIAKYADLARKYGLDLIAYEGGQHLVGVGEAVNLAPLTRLFIAANRHPRMYDLTRRHLHHWFAAGGGLYTGFLYVAAPNKWGSWGVLEYQGQPVSEAHKYRALLDGMKRWKE